VFVCVPIVDSVARSFLIFAVWFNSSSKMAAPVKDPGKNTKKKKKEEPSPPKKVNISELNTTETMYTALKGTTEG